jgi:hypothetical protein
MLSQSTKCVCACEGRAWSRLHAHAHSHTRGIHPQLNRLHRGKATGQWRWSGDSGQGAARGGWSAAGKQAATRTSGQYCAGPVAAEQGRASGATDPAGQKNPARHPPLHPAELAPGESPYRPGGQGRDTPPAQYLHSHTGDRQGSKDTQHTRVHKRTGTCIAQATPDKCEQGRGKRQHGPTHTHQQTRKRRHSAGRNMPNRARLHAHTCAQELQHVSLWGSRALRPHLRVRARAGAPARRASRCVEEQARGGGVSGEPERRGHGRAHPSGAVRRGVSTLFELAQHTRAAGAVVACGTGEVDNANAGGGGGVNTVPNHPRRMPHATAQLAKPPSAADIARTTKEATASATTRNIDSHNHQPRPPPRSPSHHHHPGTSTATPHCPSSCVTST